jgi:putative hydrolase of the HAD superfamily
MEMRTRQIHAVVFDLWKTLVPLPEKVKLSAFTETSRVLGIPPIVLKKYWRETRNQRETGDLFEYLKWLNGKIGAMWSEQKMMEAIEVRKKIHGSLFQIPDADAVTVLSTLRSQGIKLAVVSNCSSDVKEMLSGSVLAPFFHAVILSSETGMMKPDTRIFTYAANRLGVHNSQCLYIGDGHDNELEGAFRAGMYPIMLDKDDGIHWDGERVLSLLPLLEYVNANNLK